MSAGDTVKDKKTKKKSKRKISIIDEKPQSIVNVDFVMQILLEKVFGNAQEDERKSKSLILKKSISDFLFNIVWVAEKTNKDRDDNVFSIDFQILWSSRK